MALNLVLSGMLYADGTGNATFTGTSDLYGPINITINALQSVLTNASALDGTVTDGAGNGPSPLPPFVNRIIGSAPGFPEFDYGDMEGMPGFPGHVGTDGLPGRCGLPGMDAEDGLDGLPGSPGVAGTIGINGAIGLTGLPGIDGQDDSMESMPQYKTLVVNGGTA